MGPTSVCGRGKQFTFEDVCEVGGARFRFIPACTHALESDCGNQRVGIPLCDHELVRMEYLYTECFSGCLRKMGIRIIVCFRVEFRLLTAAQLHAEFAVRAKVHQL